jgi:DNA-binding FadR family transcriptional regulator
MEPSRRGRVGGIARTRAELTAEAIADMAAQGAPGDRIGSREELRAAADVSVGTLNEALRILQSSGIVTVRPGPGGGVFVADRSVFAGIDRDVRDIARLHPDLAQVTRVVRALDPLIVADAARHRDAARVRELRDRMARLEAARDQGAGSVLRASLDTYLTIIGCGPDRLLRAFGGTLVAAQAEAIGAVEDGPEWHALVDAHLASVRAVVTAIIDGDADAAIRARADGDAVELFEAVLRAR